ncbi:hypothetical protein [Flavobacterium yafengii]|uniref:hypothetical protein n=1 Tax=Flavobacterium yafengii TaxID=3041253 RepID=UPI0024A7B8B4|nr:hypothetical protein [Flavobacterium yafengii]MDI5889455.1 hypothetical protein [Flavobacterium yafengii]
MIKEIFDIEPIQKNALLSLTSISFLSFLQLYLFKNEIFYKSPFEIIGISLSLTVCWSVLNIPPLLFFYNAETPENENETNVQIEYEKVIFIFGVLAIGWITLLTYISYELKLCFKDFIRLSILTSIVRTIFWLIFGTIKDHKKRKLKQK